MTKAKHTSGQRRRKSKIRQQRLIKVNQTHYTYQLKDDLVGAGRPVPWIQLKGHWLEQAGFAIDTPVKVRVMERCLVLTVQGGQSHDD